MIIPDQTGKKFYYTDMQNLAIYEKQENVEQVTLLVKDFEGAPFNGPHALILSSRMSCPY